MTAALRLLAALAAAQPTLAAAAQPAPAAEPAATQGVTRYPAAYFADAKASTAYDMVLRLPGFTLDTGATVRGFEGAAGNVLVDGARPVSKTDTLDQILQRIPAAQVDHIEVIRGGAPGIDMQGKSILANVVRAKAAGFQGLIALANSHNVDDRRNKFGLRLEGTGHAGPGDWEGSARYGEGFDDGVGFGRDLTLDRAGHITDLSNIRAFGNVHQWTLTGAYELPVLGGRLRVNGRGFWDYYRATETDTGLFPGPVQADGYDHQDRIQSELGGRYAKTLRPGLDLELIGLRQAEDKTFTSDFRDGSGPSRFTLDRHTVETIARGVLKYRPTERLSFEAGGESALNTLQNRTGFSIGGVAIPLPAANVHVEEDRAEGFGKAVWRPTRQWTVEGGLRYETSSISSTGDVRLEKDLQFAKPRLFVTWAPRTGTQVRARYEREVGQLNFDDFVASSSLATGVVTTGNPDLNPEQAWVGELAIEQGFWKNGTAAITVRHYELTDAVDRAPVFGPSGVFDAPANIGDGTKDELQFDLTLPLDPLGVKGGQLHGTSTWRRSEVTDPTTHAKREISGLKPLEWEAHFTQDLPRWNANWGVDAFGGWTQRYYRSNEIATDKQLDPWVAIFAEYKPRGDLVFRGELDNVLERGFRHTREVFDGPRGAGVLQFIQDRDPHAGRGVYFKVRKTFS